MCRDDTSPFLFVGIPQNFESLDFKIQTLKNIFQTLDFIFQTFKI